MIERLLSVDRRVIFLFVGFAVIAATFWPVSLPITPTANVRNVYDAIEDLRNKEGATVLMSFDYEPSTVPELQPAAINVLRQCFRHDIRVVIMALVPSSVGLAQVAIDSVAPLFDKRPGRDWAFLGYKPGQQMLIINMGQNIHSAFPVDVEGRSTRTMEAMSGIEGLGDFDYVLVLASNETLFQYWIPYGVDRYRVRLGGAVTAVMSPHASPYLQSGQLAGLISGIAGAAEYETLVGAPGSAVRGMAPQTAVHGVIVLLIIVGNAMYLVQRRRARSGGTA